MKIALVTAYFYPVSAGGTEKYVLSLAKSLIEQHHQVHIITAGNKKMAGTFEDIAIYYVNDELSNHPDILSSRKASENLDAFKGILDDNKYDLVHFHTLTPAFNTFHISAAKKLNAEIYFTAHVPGITCVHGDLMQFGKHACDGLIQKHRCTACYISKKIKSRSISNVVAKTINILNYPVSTATVVERKINNLVELDRLCNKIFLFTHWQKEIFIKNGFDPKKILITSQLLNKAINPQNPVKREIKNVGFVGRISHEKGLHILIEAFKLANRTDLQLHIAGIINDEKYYSRLKKITATNSNIKWQTNLSEAHTNDFYKIIDLLVIPSIWLETGPFVLYEAFHNNLPIVTNNLGDMSIWKDKGFNIELYNNVNDLANLINKLK